MTAYEIDIQADHELPTGAEAQLQRAISACLSQQQVDPPAMLTLMLTGDDQMRQMNLAYREVDAATDVLSFPAGDAMPGMDQMPRYLGDIIISQATAVRQAAAAGHEVLAELMLLAVHGVLHLLGHDHAEAGEKEVMWQAQAAVLAGLGLAHIEPTEDAHA